MAKAKRAKTAKNPPQGNTWWENAEEVPRAGLPDAEKMSKKAKRMRRLVWATIFLAPFSMGVTFLAVAGVLGGNTTEPTSVTADAYADTKPSAIVAVREWLASVPAPLPGGVLVGWHSATSESQAGNAQNGDPSYTVESHRLTVADAAGNLYDTYVSLGIEGNGEPTLIDTPNLLPRVPGGDAWNGPDWFGVDDQSQTPEIAAAVSAWAVAYSSGDPASLRLTVGDDDASRNYMPLSGALLSEASITAVGGIWGDVAPADRTGTAETVVVRVQFQIEWRDENGEVPDTTSNDSATVTYDLLVKKANTAAPVVVAWGGTGTGPDLSPYGNAVSTEITDAAPPVAEEDVDLGEDDPAPVEPSTTEEPTDTGSTDADGTKKNKKGTNQ